MDLKLIRNLVRIMERGEVDEIEIEDEKAGLRVHLRRGAAPGSVPQIMMLPGAAMAAAGDWPATASFILNGVCGGDADLNTWVLDWCASLFQQPGRHGEFGDLLEIVYLSVKETPDRTVKRRSYGGSAGPGDRKAGACRFGD